MAEAIFGKELNSFTIFFKPVISGTRASSLPIIPKAYVYHDFFVPRVSAPVASHTIDMQRAEWTMCRPTPQSEDDNVRYVFHQGPLRSQARANRSEPYDTQTKNDLLKLAMVKVGNKVGMDSTCEFVLAEASSYVALQA